VSVYSQRFAVTNSVTNWVELATVPADELWILRDIELVNSGTAEASLIQMSLESPGGQAIFLTAQNVPVLAHVQWEGRIVLNAGDQFWANCVGSTASITVSGYNFAT
jgi:hypothetical protein